LQQLRRHIQPRQRVLDIGRSRLTDMIAERFHVRVDALGFDTDGPISTGRYYQFDLNDCQHPNRLRTDLPAYDAIVFAEVLEHLHTSPTLVLNYLADLLSPGGIMIVQTPNAVALPRRAAMLLGRNPFERIREDASNPGHFREYTADELRVYATGAGLDVEQVVQKSYFDYRYAHHGKTHSNKQLFVANCKNWIYPILPPSFRPGLTCIARKPSARQAA
jgi:hypothetical protein